MKRVLFLVVLFFSFVYTEVSYAQDMQDKYIELKVELEVLKNKANTTNELQKDIKELEQKLNNLEQSTKINEQRFNDFNSGIGFYLSIYGIFITVLLVFGYFWSVSKTKEQIKEWLEKEGSKELEKLSSEAQVKINNHVERLEKDINNIRQKYEKEFDIDKNSLDKSKLTQQQVEQLQKDAQEIIKIVEEKRSLQEWSNLFLSQKDTSKALQIAEKMKHYYPFEGYFYMGVAYSKQKKYDKALDTYKTAILLNPLAYGVYQNMGFLYTKQEKYNEALDAYKKALEINPNGNSIYLNLYELFMMQNILIEPTIEHYLRNHIDRKVQIVYNMLQLFKDISEGKEVEIDRYFTEYQDNLYELKTWSFDELKTWANKKEEPIKTNLSEAINKFKTKLGQ